MRIRHFILNDRYVKLFIGRPPGKVFAYCPATRERVDPRALVEDGQQCEKPPALLSLGERSCPFDEVKLWLPEEEWPQWERIRQVRYGGNAIIRAVENKINHLEKRSDFETLLIDPDPSPGERPVAEWIADEADLPDDFCPETEDDRHPGTYWNGGGLLVEGDLPGLLDGDVEIAVIAMFSAMGDVISIRAQRHGDKIRYYAVDEYDEKDCIEVVGRDGDIDERSVPLLNEEGRVVSKYNCSPSETSEPLTLGEMKDLLDTFSADDYGRVFETAWWEQFEHDPGEDFKEAIKNYRNDYYLISSDFYSGLDEWLGEKFEKWKREQIGE
jgi:hypothetical protein